MKTIPFIIGEVLGYVFKLGIQIALTSWASLVAYGILTQTRPLDFVDFICLTVLALCIYTVVPFGKQQTP